MCDRFLIPGLQLETQEYAQKLCEKDMWGRSIWLFFCKQTKDMKLLVLPVNAHGRMIPGDEELI